MLIGLCFLLGMANFAMLKAVMVSRHRLLLTLPAALRARGGRLFLGVEFALLVLAMMAARNGWLPGVWIYVLYTAVNGAAAWMILSRRI